MGHDSPTVVSSCTLDDDGARRLWNWLLRRHGLSEGAKFDSVLEIARATLGLHAARLPSPFATVVARSVSPTVASTLFEAETHVDLMTVRCMRKTLHVLPLELAAVAHGATLHFRERDALRAITNANVSLPCVSGVVDAMVDLLEREGPMRIGKSKHGSSRHASLSSRYGLRSSWLGSREC